MTNLKTVAVLAITAGTVAFSSYYVYKTYKRVKKEYEEEKTFNEKVNAEIENHENKESIEAYNKIVKVNEERSETLDIQMERRKEVEEIAVESGEDPNTVVHYDDSEELLYMMDEQEEEKVLHDPNSQAAMSQFVSMELSDIDDVNILKVMDDLYRIGVQLGKEDHILHGRMLENRANFFGVSKWTEDLSMADILLNYAKMEAYDLDAEIEHTIHVYLENLGIYDATEPIKFDVNRLNVQAFLEHEWVYEGSYGMFGLDQHELLEVKIDTERTTGIQILTFQAEYNKYLEVQLG